MNYTVDYFINKFESIPDSEMGFSQPTGCAYGQCRMPGHEDGSKSPEGIALETIMVKLLPLNQSKGARYPPWDGTPARINNGDTLEYQQTTPKQRILAALYDIKAKEIQISEVHEVLNNVREKA